MEMVWHYDKTVNPYSPISTYVVQRIYNDLRKVWTPKDGRSPVRAGGHEVVLAI